MPTPTGQRSPSEELGVSYIHVLTIRETTFNNVTSLKEALFVTCILGENWGISTMLNSTGSDISYKLGSNVPTSLCYTVRWSEEDQHRWNS